VLILQRPWTRQPQYPQLRSAFARHCTTLLVGSNRSLVKGVFGVDNPVFTYPGIAASKDGIAVTATSSVQLLSNGSTAVPDGTEFTCIYVNALNNTAAAPNLTNGQQGLQGILEFHCYFRYSDGNAYFRWGGNTDGVTSVSGPAPASNGVWLLSTGAEGMQIWRNGILIASNTASPNRGYNSLSLRHANGGSVSVAVPLLGFFAKQYPKPINKALSENPWQLFAPRRIPIPAPAAAATAPTITALSARLITATSAQPRISYS
jgi:hypothetical protein